MSSQPRRVVAALHRRAAAGGRDRGTVSVFFAIAVIGMIMVIGIVADAGGRLQAGVNIDEYANEAARVGAEQVDAADAITGQSIQIDCSTDSHSASVAVASYLNRAGLVGTVTKCTNRSVTVTIKSTYQAIILPYTFPITGVGTATLYAGQNQAPNPEQP